MTKGTPSGLGAIEASLKDQSGKFGNTCEANNSRVAALAQVSANISYRTTSKAVTTYQKRPRESPCPQRSDRKKSKNTTNVPNAGWPTQLEEPVRPHTLFNSKEEAKLGHSQNLVVAS